MGGTLDIVSTELNTVGVYVDSLEKQLRETADIGAPTLMGVLVPLSLYADGLTLMCEGTPGLQKQLDALASCCEPRQLAANLSKTEIFVFEGKQSSVQNFMKR